MSNNSEKAIQHSVSKFLSNPLVSLTSFVILILAGLANIIIIWDFIGKSTHGRFAPMLNIFINWLASLFLIVIFVFSLSITLLSIFLRGKEKDKEVVYLKNSRILLFTRLHRQSALVNYLAQKCFDPSKAPKENEKYKNLMGESYELFSFLENLLGKFIDEIERNPEAKSIYDFTVSNLKPHVKHPSLYDIYDKLYQ